MNTTIEIALLHLIILASQSFYMYLSSKSRMKKKWYMYILAIPFVMSFPAILYNQDQYAYSLYEYAVVICIITAAVADITYAAFRNKDYMTDESFCIFLYSYFLICATSAWSGKTQLLIRIITTIVLISAIVLCGFTGKHFMKWLFKAALLAILSIAVSWMVITFAL